MLKMGFSANDLRPALYSHVQKGSTVVVHVGDFLCA